MKFDELGLKEEVLSSLDRIGFKTLTPTQEMTLPSALLNKSFACKGKTGSGKTHCFLIPIANDIDYNNKSLQSVILAPTRELATQLTKVARELFKETDVKIVNLTGGKDTLNDQEKIRNVQILIGTPTRIANVGIDQGLINFKNVKHFVIDEADMTLEMGFLNEIDRIATLCKTAQIMLFSATIPAGLRFFIRKYFKTPLLFEDSKDNANENIRHILYPLRNKDKREVLLNIIKHINPYVCLIFTNTKEEVEKTYNYLVNNGIDALIIHGDLDSRIRKANIKKAIEGKYKYIVCSDIAARGIDIEGVSHVVMLDFPKNNLEYYVHRAGRAGRALNTGMCISLFNKEDNNTIEKLKERGIEFEIYELKNDEFTKINEFVFTKNKKKDDPLQQEINKVVRMKKSKTVKPNYKKKVKAEVEKVKRRHRREIIRNDIKKQIRERAIKKTKGL